MICYQTITLPIFVVSHLLDLLSVFLSPLCLPVSPSLSLSLFPSLPALLTPSLPYNIMLTISSYTADNTEDVCIGSDPHFGIRLPEGSLLCYTFQGEHNSTFNIISNSQFKMNALFVPDSRRVNNTWIGSIGITVYHNGKKTTTLQFIAANNTIIIASRIEVDAYTVGKISFHQERYTIVDATYKNSSRFPRVDVEFLDSDLKFTVAFVKDQHINLEWHSVGEPFMDSRGVVGNEI